MTEVSQQAAQYLEDVFDTTGLQLRVSVKQGAAGEETSFAKETG